MSEQEPEMPGAYTGRYGTNGMQHGVPVAIVSVRGSVEADDVYRWVGPPDASVDVMELLLKAGFLAPDLSEWETDRMGVRYVEVSRINTAFSTRPPTAPLIAPPVRNPQPSTGGHFPRKLYEAFGEQLTVNDWSVLTGISVNTLQAGYSRHGSLEVYLRTRRYTSIEAVRTGTPLERKPQSLKDWGDLMGVAPQTVHSGIKRHGSLEAYQRAVGFEPEEPTASPEID